MKEIKLKNLVPQNLNKLGPVIAIDGPAGTGKSSVTHRLAEVLHYVHVDTGALYRAIGYLTIESVGTESVMIQEVALKIAKQVHLEFNRIPNKNPANRIYADGRDVTDFIRTAPVSMMASSVSKIPEVRISLLELQRRLGCQGKTILEGRDIGTIIFPDADIKFFLTASIDERAKRRLLELEGAGEDAPSYQEVRNQMMERDHNDSTRAVAPLKMASDAIEVDTTFLTLDEVVQKMEKIVRERLTKDV